MKLLSTLASAAATSVLALTVPAQAQQAQTQQAQTQQTSATDSQCLERLNALAQRMNAEGYALGTYPGTGGYGARYPYGTMGGTRTPTGATPGVADGAAAPAGNPWTGVAWEQRPSYEMGTLYRAASILATNGNEQACATVADAVEERYQQYVAQLNDLGVEPGQISSWRQAELATAMPVGETGFPRRIEDILGSDVRNPQDEDLGDIDDVVLDGSTGDIRYVIVSSGGFFGIGSEEIAVPWEHLHVVPSTGTFILPVQQEAMEQAPRIDTDAMVDLQQTGSTRADEVSTYWRDALGQQAR